MKITTVKFMEMLNKLEHLNNEQLRHLQQQTMYLVWSRIK